MPTLAAGRNGGPSAPAGALGLRGVAGLTALALLIVLAGCGGLSAAEVQNNAGVELHRLARYDEAVAAYDEALLIAPDLAVAYYNRGLIHARLQRFELAIVDYDEAISLEPRRPQPYRARALAFDAVGRRALAAADFGEADRLLSQPGAAEGRWRGAYEDLRRIRDDLSMYWAPFLGAIGAGLMVVAVPVAFFFLRWWAGRPLLKPRARLDYLHDLHGSDGVLTLFLEARNPRSKHVTVTSFGLELDSETNSLIPLASRAGYVYPHEVAKSQSIIEWCEVPNLVDILDELGRTPSDLRRVWFKALSGERYWARLDRHVIDGLAQYRISTTTAAP